MQEFRRFIRGPVGKFLLAAIVIPFVAVPFLDYFTGSSAANTVAEVEGSKISRDYLNQRVEQVRNRLRQQSPNLSPALLDSFVRPEMVLDGLVNEQLILAAAEQSEMVFSENQVAKEIYQVPLFQLDGKFSEEVFERELRSRGINPQGYIRGLRQDMVKEQYRTGFMATDFALPVELDEQRRLGEQVRDIRFVKLDMAALRKNFTVSDDEIASFYQENQGEFMRPEEFRIAYVSLAVESYMDQVSVSEEEVATEYAARKAMMEEAGAGDSAKKVSHILIELNDNRDLDQAKARAREAASAIASGESFAAAAAQFSDDLSTANDGGDLGVLSKGALPEEMEEAIATLQPGTVSEPVVSDAGVHLIMVTEEGNQREMPSLAELSEQIRSDLKKARAEALLNEDVAKLEDLLFEHSDLVVPAEEVGATVETTEWVALAGLPPALSSESVQQALNSDQVRRDGHNSDLLEVAPGKYLAVRIAEQKPAEALPLEDVRAAITQRLRAQKAADKAQALNDEAGKKLEDGASLEDIAILFASEIEELEGLQRGDAEPAMEVVNAAFTAARPAEGAATAVALTRLGNGSVVAYQVTRVQDGSLEPLDSAQQQVALAELGRVEGQRNFRQVVASLRESSEVEVFLSRLAPNQEEIE